MKLGCRSAVRLLSGIAALVGVAAFAAPAAAQTNHAGACCLPSGHCVHRTEPECQAVGGIFQGAGVSCASVQCQPATGACCIASSTGLSCHVLTYDQCRQANGHFRGFGTDCTTHPCPGACCLPGGFCIMRSEAECDALSGTFVGGPCATANCIQPTGACCIPDSTGGFTCHDLTFQQCQTHSGHFRGPGTTCASHPCPLPRGACCLPNGRCILATETECLAHHGTFQGGPCSAANCPQPTGACCIPDSTGGFTCEELSFQACRAQNGLFRGPGTECTNQSCPPPRGACCLPSGHCVLTSEANCISHGGTFQGGPCSGAHCPQPTGACCIPDLATGGFTCEELTRPDCRVQGGHFRGPNTTCSANACPPPRGACCLPGMCVMTFEQMCINHHGTWQGGGVLCVPDPCGRAGGEGGFGPELIADFNGSWRVDITDAILFMEAYAAGEADIDGNGITDRNDLVLFIHAFSEASGK